MDSAAAVVDAAIRSRKAVRAFLPTAVPRALVAEILEVARHAPSNSNTQPWRVHVLQGRARQALSEALLRSHEQDALPPSAHFPPQLPPACQRRQADFGARYYSAVGIDRADLAARHRQTGRNFDFFGAPVGLIFTIDAVLGPHSWADYGMFLQSIMLAARARGLDSCPQVSFVRHAPVIRALLGLAADEAVVCGMSLGFAEPDAAVNRCAMPRDGVEDFAVFWD
jgi:nitroreductase